MIISKNAIVVEHSLQQLFAINGVLHRAAHIGIIIWRFINAHCHDRMPAGRRTRRLMIGRFLDQGDCFWIGSVHDIDLPGHQSCHAGVVVIDDGQLDRVEGTLLQARSKIERLCANGEPVDLVKVERTLMQLAEHINQSVRRADDNYINLLRDSRVQLVISETGERDARTMKVELTLISIDKLMAWKLREGPSDPEAWIELIDAMGKVVLQNVQILSSLILTLFAARDYTTGVVQLVSNNQNEPPRVAAASAIATLLSIGFVKT